MEGEVTDPAIRRGWVLSQDAWSNFLRRLDADRDQAGQKYEVLRARLITIFRCRGFADPASLADESIDRIAKGMEREEIRDIFPYASGVARHVASEAHRRPAQVSLDKIREPRQRDVSDGEAKIATQMVCLDICMASLSEIDRDLIRGWYQNEKGQKAEDKRQLAASLGISIGTLRVRAFRVRDQTRHCVSKCMSRKLVTFSQAGH